VKSEEKCVQWTNFMTILEGFGKQRQESA